MNNAFNELYSNDFLNKITFLKSLPFEITMPTNTIIIDDIFRKGEDGGIYKYLNDLKDLNKTHKVVLLSDICRQPRFIIFRVFYYIFISIALLFKNYQTIIFPYTYIPLGIWRRPIFVVHDCRSFFTNFNSSLRTFYIKALLKFSIKFSYKIVTISDFTKNQLVSIFPAYNYKIVRIYNSFVLTQRDSTLVKKDQFCYVGHIEERKNLKMLVAIAKKFTNYEFMILGKVKAQYNNTFRILIDGVDNITYMGFVDDTIRNDMLQKSKWFINLSNYEGFSYTPLEAYDYGCHLILSDIPSHKEVVGFNNALFLRSNEDDIINFEIIEKYIENDNIISNIEMDRFSQSSFIEHWNKIVKLN